MEDLERDRNRAIALWRAHNDDESLYRHALSVEAVLRHFAAKSGQDADYWGCVGLLHDIDYGRYPEEHLAVAPRILREAGYGEPFVRAVLAHGWGICSDVEPLDYMEKALFATDELAGFVAACCFVRPSRSVLDLETSSVRKKWKTAAFAAGVDRGVVEKGAAMLGVGLDELVADVIAALRPVAAEVGLKGNL
jgi:putative nucleotidyltransferase with HDIG domain